jgi:hypothetical protein
MITHLRSLELGDNRRTRSPIEERYTWPVRTVLLGGGNLRVTSYQIDSRKLVAVIRSFDPGQTPLTELCKETSELPGAGDPSTALRMT